ncbi:M23 family metallopeptidase [Corynebacterium comes]|uniref:Murein DD-endopeptidase MepM n=1 Tax=Corynebacterium comes TaxID=2675218 RepID=A0A6B8WAW1_9CORY|nr:M23 family metallopeptidase [Corynebacterium comes]QGU04018.1 Murein DD-endopeptidase MepM [Corynebacterium comes]
MTRTCTKALIAAAFLSTGLGSAVVAPAAGAQEASFQVTGEGVTDADLNDLITALNAVGKLAETLEATSESSGDGTTDGTDLQVILDPLEALSSAISVVSPDSLIDVELDDVVSAVRMSPVRGETADGRTVVFPTSGRYTSGYGARWGATHEGIDIADPVGTPVLAVMDGEVISAGPADGFGQWVRLKHDDGSISVYGHVNTVDVPVGQRVTAGDQIATLGNEGRSTGPHLHFEIRPTGNGPVDPVSWFAQQGIDVA